MCQAVTHLVRIVSVSAWIGLVAEDSPDGWLRVCNIKDPWLGTTAMQAKHFTKSWLKTFLAWAISI